MSRPNSPAPGPHYHALIELLRTAEALWNSSRIFFARWNLSPSQFNVLNLLSQMPGGCTQSELSRQLIMHRSNATGLVDRLEARGLVRREDNATDRRAFSLALTPTGRKLVDEIQPHYHAAAAAVWGKIPTARARQLVEELKTVSENAGRVVAKESKDAKID